MLWAITNKNLSLTLIVKSSIIIFYLLGIAMSVFSINNTNLYLQPAPWRKSLQSRKEIISDWLDGKDFKIINGPYCSIRDLQYMRSDFNRIFIVYSNGTIEV